MALVRDVEHAWPGRDAESALIATTRLLALARKAMRRVHVLHVSTEAELTPLIEARPLASFEVLPQHLTFAAPEVYERFGAMLRERCGGYRAAVLGGNRELLEKIGLRPSLAIGTKNGPIDCELRIYDVPR